MTFTAPDGTEIELRDAQTGGQPLQGSGCYGGPSRGKVFIAADGSAATFVSEAEILDERQPHFPNVIYPSGYLMLRDGTRYRIDSGKTSWFRDANGNQVSFTYSGNDLIGIDDSLNRHISVSGGTISFKGANGVTRTLTIHGDSLSNVLRKHSDGSTEFTIKTFSQLFPNLQNPQQGTFNPWVVKDVELPDGRKYEFRYDSYANLAQVILPTKYDRWGNRTVDFTQDPGDPHLRTYGINSAPFKIDPQTNQLYSPNDQFLPNDQTNNLMKYDVAGNLKHDAYSGAGNRTYDGENRITSAWGGNNQAQLYAYDASGQRIKRTVNGVQTFQVFGFGGELVAEYPATPAVGSPQKEYAYRNGQLLITAEPGAAAAPTAGLIAYWKLDENSGATTADSSGNGHTGTLTNGPTWTAGQVNAGVSFDGVNDQVVNNGIADVTNNFTISFWAQPTATHEIDGESTAGFGGTAGQRYALWPLWYDNGHTGAGVSVGSNGVSVYEHAANYMPAPLVYSGSLNGWTHVTVVYENKQPKLYINGSLVSTGLTSPMSFVHINPFELGGDVYGYYAGKLDDIRVYNRALSAAEVATLPNGSGASGAQLKWLVTDQLGTPRMVLDQSGALANVKRHDYLPFGEELLAPTGGRTSGQGYGGDGVRQQFTGQERDSETGLDYFLARYYSSSQGRFVSVDPLAASAHAAHPQTWNRYSYVLNNPLKHTDPTGMTVAEYDQMSQAAIEQRRWFHAAKQSEQPADTSVAPAPQPQEPETNNPPTIDNSGAVNQACSIQVSFSGQYDGLPNGPSVPRANGVPVYGIGFSVNISGLPGNVALRSSEQNPKPKRTWLVEQWVADYNFRDGQVVRHDTKARMDNLAGAVPGPQRDGDRVSWWDHPGDGTPNLRGYFTKRNFYIKAYNGTQHCELAFHLTFRVFNGGITNAGWGPGNYNR